MEKIITVISDMKKPKFLGSDAYTAVLTDKRIIFAKVTSSLLKEETKKARAGAKGFFGKWGSQIAAFSNFAERYKTMHVEDILKENPDNFYLDNDSVKNIDVRSSQGDKLNHEVKIETAAKNYKFTARSSPVKQFRQVFKDLV